MCASKRQFFRGWPSPFLGLTLSQVTSFNSLRSLSLVRTIQKTTHLKEYLYEKPRCFILESSEQDTMYIFQEGT